MQGPRIETLPQHGYFVFLKRRKHTAVLILRCFKSCRLTSGNIQFQVALIHGVQDVVDVSILPDEAAGVRLLVQTIEEKAGLDRALLGAPLHEGDVAARLFAAGAHAVLVPIQARRRNERRSFFHRLICVEDKVLPTFFEPG